MGLSKYVKFLQRLARDPVKELKRKFGPTDTIPLPFVAKYVPASPIILEAGAADGGDTVTMSQFWPGCQIHAFEPVPQAYAQLVQKSKDLANIHTYPAALSDRDGTAELFVSEGPSRTDSSSLQPPTGHVVEIPAVKFNKRVEVSVMRLDRWAERYSIKRIDLMWLDMQGHELAALKQGTQLLKTVSAIHMEVFQKELYAGSPLYPEVRQWMEGQGFIVVKEAMLWPTGNILFVRQK